MGEGEEKGYVLGAVKVLYFPVTTGKATQERKTGREQSRRDKERGLERKRERKKGRNRGVTMNSRTEEDGGDCR